MLGFRAPRTILLTVVVEVAPTGSDYLQTGSKDPAQGKMAADTSSSWDAKRGGCQHVVCCQAIA